MSGIADIQGTPASVATQAAPTGVVQAPGRAAADYCFDRPAVGGPTSAMATRESPSGAPAPCLMIALAPIARRIVASGSGGKRDAHVGDLGMAAQPVAIRREIIPQRRQRVDLESGNDLGRLQIPDAANFHRSHPEESHLPRAGTSE